MPGSYPTIKVSKMLYFFWGMQEKKVPPVKDIKTLTFSVFLFEYVFAYNWQIQRG